MNSLLHTIPAFVINLERRTDRRAHVVKEFEGRTEFELHIVNGIESADGATGLWATIVQIVSHAIATDYEFIVICEDDHTFTDAYNPKEFFSHLRWATVAKADLLLGGVSSLKSIFKITDGICWIESFSGLQFTVVFRTLFQRILAADFGADDAADYKISALTNEKYLLFPFFSIQRDFGYSDATKKNNEVGRVASLFDSAEASVRYILDTQVFYDICVENYEEQFTPDDLDNFSIPTYVINLPDRTDRRKHIVDQFAGREEFELRIEKATRHPVGGVGLWLSIRNIIQKAIDNDDDVIIICEDDHIFGETYSRELLLANIIKSHFLGADILSGGVGNGFDFCFPVSTGLFWVNHFYSTQFIVVFRKFFRIIIEAPFDDSVTADDFLSGLTPNKFVMYPFISTQKNFGYSDATVANNIFPTQIDSLFKDASKRLDLISLLWTRYFKKEKESPLDEASDVTVIVTVWRRQNLEEQIRAIAHQTCKPRSIWVYHCGSHTSIDTILERYPWLEVIKSSVNLKYFGRFALAQFVKTKFVWVIDDDVVPSKRWLEVCRQKVESESVVVCSAGRRVPEGNDWSKRQKDLSKYNFGDLGWSFGANFCPKDTIVDFGCNSWVLKTAWLKSFFSVFPYTLENGEDIHLSAVLRSKLGIETIVIKQDEQVCGNLQITYGQDIYASWTKPNFSETRRAVIEYLRRELGWVPILMDETRVPEMT